MTLTEDIQKAVSVMRRGGLIAYPTDTVWGIGCDATCSEAVRRVFEVKRRADSKALITLVDTPDMLQRFAGGVTAEALDIAVNSPRPTTVVYPYGIGVAPELLASDGSIGIRLSHEAYSAGLCEAMGVPVVSTSANISGMPSPRFYDEISPEILDAVDYVALYRRADHTAALPSRVVMVMTDGNLKVIRP
ncbi:MAG: Sua5/YciO/YrdC/YwlC family protein [Muribaculaceae bacterium]|nr:Sua5/YciO/YrdC/YwlC family protein [Muribaculaceae bacterium]